MEDGGRGGILDSTLVLGPRNEPQPDHMLFIAPERGGTLRVEGKFARGIPELAVEVSVSTKAVDLGSQRVDYERAGIPEYVVFAAEPEGIFWHVLREGRLVVVPPDADGLHRSRSFPGLWLDPSAFWGRDYAGILATLDLGMATQEYVEFTQRLRGIR